MSWLRESIIMSLLSVCSNAKPELFESTGVRLVLVLSITLKSAMLALEADSWGKTESAWKLCFDENLD